MRLKGNAAYIQEQIKVMIKLFGEEARIKDIQDSIWFIGK